MKKLQQFNVFAFTYERLKNSNFNITIDTFQAEKNEELIALADNECLRAIRRITKHPFNDMGEMKLQDLLDHRRFLTKQRNSEENRKMIANVNNEIRNLLFIPEFISVNTSRKKNYPKIGRDGFFVNGVHFSRFSCSAGNARTNRSMFVSDCIFNELVSILRCGCKDIPLVAAKYNAYFSLTSSATFQVSTPRVCVIHDCEEEREELVDWVNETEEVDIEETITREVKKLKFNLFDGMGLISPEFADVWSNDLDLDYKSSAYCLRNAFIKGMVCVFDFKRFASEVAQKNEVVDLWGKTHNIFDIDIILTESQFKLWNAYDSWDEYEKNVIKSNLSWGVSKFAPKPEDEKHIMRSNYQFLQVLDLSDEDISELCKPTIDWFKDITNNNPNKMALYLLGKRAREVDEYKLWANTQDNYVKSLLLEPKLVGDNYIQQKIKQSLNKRLRESYIGKLLIKSNFEVAIADPYAFCEHLFNMPVIGLLVRDTCFCKYWQDRDAKTCAVLRSPLTWKSEVDILELPNMDKMQDWYKYIESGVVMNVHGLDCNLLGGNDFDFDIFFITNNEYFIKGALNDKIPVCYHPKKAPKVNINIKELYKTDVLGYDTEVGFKTNIGTTFQAMIALYDLGSDEYNTLLNRHKLCCYQQSAEIDSTKGIAKKPMPKFWTKYTKILDTDTPSIIKEKKFLNKLVVDKKRPYFMKYKYKDKKKDYENFINDFNTYSYSMYGCKFEDIQNEMKNDNNYIKLKDYYDNKCNLIDSSSTMNKICHYLEQELCNIKHKNKKFDNYDAFETLFNPEIELDNSKLELLQEKKKEYEDFKKTKQLKTSEFNTYEQYYKYLRNDCLEKISSNIQELANLAVYICYNLYPNKPKDFCWDIFGAGIVENLKLKHNVVKIPHLCKTGDIEYLGEKYEMVDIELSKENTNDLINYDMCINEYDTLFDDADKLFEDLGDDLC